ncbi:MAG: hypothetical protein GC160_28870 [Acidobacteria bacterium]|nr:hypothetical protein [Acidobacteriota bacterium]
MVYVGYLTSLLYLLVRVSRCTDYFGYVLAHLRVPFAILGLGILAAIVTGRIFNAMLSKQGARVLGLTFLFLLSSAFSLWPGGSVHQLRELWPPNLMLFLILASFLTTLQGLRTAVVMVGLGVGMSAAYGQLIGQTQDGRMAAGNMSYGNPNDYALVLLLGMPPMLYLIADKTRPIWLRLLMIPLLGVTVLGFVGTGSRGGLLGFCVMSVFVLLHMSWSARINAVVAAVFLAICGIAAAPRATLQRLSTFLEVQQPSQEQFMSAQFDQGEGGAEGGEDLTVTAAASARGRLHLVEQAIQVTAQHPLLGSGFGMFMVAENSLAQDQGYHRGSWKGTHNMYLQMSSENGLPAFFLFLTIIYSAWKTLRRHRQLGPNPSRNQIEMRNISFVFSASMVAFLVSSTFLTVAYDFFVMMFAAVAVGFDNVALLEQQRIAREEQEAGAETPSGRRDWAPEPVGVGAYSRGLS